MNNLGSIGNFDLNPVAPGPAAGPSRSSPSPVQPNPPAQNAALPSLADYLRAQQTTITQDLKKLLTVTTILHSAENRASVLEKLLEEIKKLLNINPDRYINRGIMEEIKKLVLEMQKELFKPIYEGKELEEIAQEVLAYMGHGFSVELKSGDIIFDFEKMLKEREQLKQEIKRTKKNLKEFKRQMGFERTNLNSIAEQLDHEMEDLLSPDPISEEDNTDEIVTDMIEMIKSQSSMLSKTHMSVDNATALKLLR